MKDSDKPIDYDILEDSLEDYGSVFDPDGAILSESNPAKRYPNFWWIELSLFANVFLSGFDGTVTASTYTTIGDEFNSTNTASWITTSYLITCTAFQPLYGSFSDILGRKVCLMGATSLFIAGCTGCGLSTNIIMLDIMRALTGIGGGGLVTLATIVNSDIIAPEQRGNWQAFQNVLFGFGSICGASFGGTIAQTFGWRWCFVLQAPIGFTGIISAYLFVKNPEKNSKDLLTSDPDDDDPIDRIIVEDSRSLDKIDFKGSITLVLALSLQALVLSLGGNQVAWSDYRLILVLLLSCIFLVKFALVEMNTTALPIIPPTLLHGTFTYFILGIGVLVGISGFAYLFILPMLFQIILGDSVSQAGLRLTIPSLFTPVGGLITGFTMSRGGNNLFKLVTCGAFLMFLGNFLALQIDKGENPWLVGLFLIPANVGQGMICPSSLFAFIYIFDKDKQAIATSTAYLFRSVGSIWGVSGSSTIIRHVLRRVAAKSLIDVPGMTSKRIERIINQVSRDISSAKRLDPAIYELIHEAYVVAIREAQMFSCLFCFLCLGVCLMKVAMGVKSRSSYSDNDEPVLK